jgi:hypothetical protein
LLSFVAKCNEVNRGGISMTTVRAELTEERAVIARDDFERLVELARRTEPVEVLPDQERGEPDMARLAQEGGAFNFWKEVGEDIYSPQDGEAI